MRSHGRMFSLLIAGSLALCAPLVAYADEVASEGGVPSAPSEVTTAKAAVTTIAELKAALEAGGEVTLGNSIEYADKVDIVITKPVTLDLNGFTVTETYAEINHFMMVIRDGGSLTLKDSSPEQTGALIAQDASYGYGIQLFSDSSFIMESGSIQTTQESIDIYTITENVSIAIKGGSITSSADSVLGIRGNKNINVEITGGEMKSAGRVGAYVSSYQEGAISISMTGGSLDSSTGSAFQLHSGVDMAIGGDASISTAGWSSAIQLQSGSAHSSLSIEGGEISSVDGLYGVVVDDDSVLDISGGKISSARMEAVKASDTSNVTVTGGSVLAGGSHDPFEKDPGATVTVSGGTYSKPLDESLLDESVKAGVQNGDGYAYYTDIEEALENTGPGGTIDMIGGDPQAALYTVTLNFKDASGSDVKMVQVKGSSIELPVLENDGWYRFDGWQTEAGDRVESPYKPVADVTLVPRWTYNPPAPSYPSYDVTIPAFDGGAIVATPAKAEAGDTVKIAVKPDAGKELVSIFVLDSKGRAVELTEAADGSYTFEMPEGGVFIEAAFACDGGDLCPLHAFSDFDPDAWYHEALDWAVADGIVRGIEGTDLVLPHGVTTRAQVVMMLARMADVDTKAPSEASFADVPAGMWCAGAVAWAVDEGIVAGYGDGAFGPDDPVTREQTALLLHRFAVVQGCDVSDRADLSAFPDADAVSPWAADAMSWAVAEGYVRGVSDAELQPRGTAERAQTATMLKRFNDDNGPRG